MCIIYVHGLFRLILVCLGFFIYSHMVMVISYIFVICNFFIYLQLHLFIFNYINYIIIYNRKKKRVN